MAEKVTLNEEQKNAWSQFRTKAVQQLISEAMQINDLNSIRYFVETGVIRAFDQRYSTAEKKLELIDADEIPVLNDLIPKGSEKQQLVRELANKQQVLTVEMLQKLSVEQLRDLANKF